MSVWRRLGALFRGRAGEAGDPHAIVFHVRCNHCGEVIRVRVDRRWDLIQEFGDGITGYSLHKEVLGTKCNRLMSVHMTFDPKYTVTAQEVEGGSFVALQEQEL